MNESLVFYLAGVTKGKKRGDVPITITRLYEEDRNEDKLLNGTDKELENQDLA